MLLNINLVEDQDMVNLESKLVEQGEDPNLVQQLIELFTQTKDQNLDTDEDWNNFIHVWEQA